MRKYIGFIIFIAVLGIILTFNLKDNKKSDLINIKVAEVTHSVFYAPFYVAIENDYFKEEGIDIDLILTSGADKVSAAVLSNDVNIGFAGPESSIYVYNGGEEDYLVSFAGLTKRDGQFILSRNNDVNFKMEDLKGKEILVGRKGGMPALNFLNALKNKGIKDSEVNLNYSVEFAALSGSFISGIGDYVNLFEPTATKIVNESYGYVVASIGELSGEVPYTAFNARKSFIEDNKDTIKKFNIALNKGLEFVKNNNESEIANIIIKQFPDATISDISKIVKRYKDYDCWLSSTFISEESFKNLENIMIDADLLDDYVDYNKLVMNFNE